MGVPIAVGVTVQQEAIAASETVETFLADMKALGLVPESQRNRILVLVFFSFVEGMCEHFRRLALAIDMMMPGELLPGERAIAEDVEWMLKEDGLPKQRARKDSTLPRIEFSLRAIAKVSRSSWTFDKGGGDWRAFVQSLRIRDRLVHPGFGKARDLSPADVLAYRAGQSWFHKACIQLLGDFLKRSRVLVPILAAANSSAGK